jgi:peptidoglycan/LPS O-acetylase OafA/YrhL
VIALIVSPFLKGMKSNGFTQFRERCIVFISRPMAMNLILVPLLLTQIILRPIFPEETHALFNDWAYFSLDLVFFLAGLILVSNTSLRDSIMKQRRLYLIQTILTTLFMFLTPHLFGNEKVAGTAWDIASIVVAWSCSMTAIGYTRRYLNRNSKFRKLANEAIYPFYLLHQPVIVVIGYYVIQWSIPILMKALIITGLSLLIVVTVYWYIIRPLNILRIIFGLKPVLKTNKSVKPGVAQPVNVPSPVHQWNIN